MQTGIQLIIRLAAFLAVLAPVAASADYVPCYGLKISSVTVEGDRDDGFPLNNKLVLKFEDSAGLPYNCAGKAYVHLENTHVAYQGFLATALAAQISEKLVDIAVNTSVRTNWSNQLAVIVVKD